MIVSVNRKLWWSLHKKSTWSSLLFWDIAKILQTCYFGYSGHTWPRPPDAMAWTCRKLWCLSAGILPDMGLAAESQESKEHSFCIVYRKNKSQNFQKSVKYPILDPFGPNLGKNEFSKKIGLRHFLASIVP